MFDEFQKSVKVVLCDWESIVNSLDFFKQPEWIALIVSVIAICVNVYISYRNRKHALAKEEYFKLQKVVEDINAKLLSINHQHIKFAGYIKAHIDAMSLPNAKVIDQNNVFDKGDFEKDIERVVALLDKYFEGLGEQWNDCLDAIAAIHNLAFKLKNDFEQQEVIQWKDTIVQYNQLTENLHGRPKLISDSLKKALHDFKKKNL